MLKNRARKNINIGKASAVALADWDGDKDLDLFVGNIDGQVWYLPNEGSASKPAFGEAVAVKVNGQNINAKDGDAGPMVVDWDRDGKPDLIVGSGSGEVTFYRNLGGPAQPKLAAGSTLIPAGAKGTDSGKVERSCSRAKVAVADWNRDGLDDLLVGDFVSGSDPTKREYHGWVWVYLRKPQETAAVR
jgi:hypothetical protein